MPRRLPRRSRTPALRALLLCLAALPALAAGAQAAPSPEGTSVLVRFDPDATAADRHDVAADLGAVTQRPLLAGWRQYVLPGAVPVPEVRADLAGQDAVAAVAPDTLVRTTYSDPHYPLQWALANTGQVLFGTPGLVDADIGFEQAVARVPTRAPVTVAVIDVGLDLTHPDLSGMLWTNPGEIPGNGVDDDLNGYIDDVHGANVVSGTGDVTIGSSLHGTAVSSVIAAEADNGVGTVGVAGNARVMAVKVGDGNAMFPISQVVAGMAYARSIDSVKVLNLSLGGYGYSAPLCDAVAQTLAEGRVVVVSAGNDDSDLGPGTYSPGACPAPDLLTVGASTNVDTRAAFSNHSATQVDLYAPGAGIPAPVSGSGYGYWNGTSFSSPMVAGAAAFVLGADPSITPARFRAAVMAGGDPMADAAPSVSGNRLDLGGLLDELGIAVPDLTPPTVPAPGAPADGATVGATPTFTWAASSDAVGVTGYELAIDGVSVATTSALSWTPPDALADGDHTWTVRARDAAANLSSWSASRSLTVDSTPPLQPATPADPPPAAAPPAGPAPPARGDGALGITSATPWTRSPVVALAIRPPGSAVAMRVTPSPLPAGAFGPVRTRATVRIAGEGRHGVSVQFRRADGTLTTPVTAEVGLDRTPPALQARARAGARTLRITVQARDGGSGPDALRTVVAGRLRTYPVPPGGRLTLTVPRSGRDQGITVTDRAGNARTLTLGAPAA